MLVCVSGFAGGVTGWRAGLLWGFAGFAVFTLAPGLGLPPELPAMPAAELLPRPAQANRPIFYADAGGETKVLSVSEVHRKFNDMIKLRLERYAAVRPTMGPGLTRPQPKK